MESAGVLEAVGQGYVRLFDMPPILGVIQQRSHQLAQRHDFPAPAMAIGRRRLWLKADVERWAAET